MPATTQCLRALSAKYSDKWSTHAFKMEYDGYLSNHLLHALSALVDLGANDKTIDAYAESYVQKLCVVTDRTRDELAPSVLVAEAPSLLGKRQNFEGLRTMYEAEIKQLTADGAVTRHLPTLVGGLAGSLLHGIIQLGYAYHVGGDLLIAEGLAYLHFSHLSFDKPTEETTTNEIPPESLLKFTRETALELIRRVQRDQTLLSEMKQHIHTPAFSTLVQGNLQRRLMSFSSDPKVGNPKLFNAIASTVDQYDFTGVNGAFVMDFALWLYAIVPHNDFVLLHATTSAWSLQQVEHLLSVDDRERAWKTWFRMALSAFIMHEVPELPPTDPFAAVDDTELASLPSWDQLITQTLALEGEVDEHVYKLVQVAHVVALDAADQQKPQSSFLTSAQREFVLKSAAQKVISTEFWEPASGSVYVTANDAPH